MDVDAIICHMAHDVMTPRDARRVRLSKCAGRPVTTLYTYMGETRQNPRPYRHTPHNARDGGETTTSPAGHRETGRSARYMVCGTRRDVEWRGWQNMRILLHIFIARPF